MAGEGQTCVCLAPGKKYTLAGSDVYYDSRCVHQKCTTFQLSLKISGPDHSMIGRSKMFGKIISTISLTGFPKKLDFFVGDAIF